MVLVFWIVWPFCSIDVECFGEVLSGKSSFSQTEEPIATLPTITFCFYYDSDAKNTTEYIYGQG